MDRRCENLNRAYENLTVDLRSNSDQLLSKSDVEVTGLQLRVQNYQMGT